MFNNEALNNLESDISLALGNTADSINSNVFNPDLNVEPVDTKQFLRDENANVFETH